MSDFPLVSVVIPCFNAENYVAEAIDSVLSQTYPHIELIVVDDKSSDRSAEIIRTYGDKLKFKQNNHNGACFSRNTGLALSQGEYVQFLDADDLLLPQKIEKQLPFLTSNQFDLVFCNGYLFGDDRPQRPIKKLQALPSPTGIDPFIYCFLNGFGTEGPLHRRSLLEKVGGFRVGLAGAQEFDLHVRLGAAGARLHKLNDYLFLHRNHNDPNRITRTPKPPGFNAEMLIGLLKSLQENMPNSLTAERCKILASSLFQKSIYAYRNGAEEIAEKGFQLSKDISPDLEYNERLFYKLIANSVNPLFAENCLKQARILRGILIKYLSSSPGALL